MNMDIDDALNAIGGFGTVQKRLFWLNNAYQLVVCFHVMLITFVGAPMHIQWECTDDNVEPDYCEQYKEGTCGLSYVDNGDFYSIVHEWELVCDKSSLVNYSQSAFFLGCLIGSYVFGWFSDQYGRHKAVVVCTYGITVLGFLAALTPNIYFFIACRFGLGFMVAGNISYYVLVCEVLGTLYRSSLAVMNALVFSIGYLLLAMTAYAIGSWRLLCGMSSLIVVPFIVTLKCGESKHCAHIPHFYRFVPKSPRWLLVSGQEAKAREVILQMSQVNQRELPDQFSLKLPNTKHSKLGALDLFMHSKLRCRTLISMYLWFTACMTYYGLSLNSGNMSNDLYVGFALSGLVEIPSSIAVYFSLEKIGRRISATGFFCIGGVASIVCGIVMYDQWRSPGHWLMDLEGLTGYSETYALYGVMCLALLGKFGISASFASVFAFTPELFSTDIRNLVMGISNVAARCGGILAPLVILLDSAVAPGSSMIVMGSLAVVGTLISLLLPETLNTPLPATINDIIND